MAMKGTAGALLASAALLVAACGGGSHGETTTAAKPASASGGLKISTTKGAAGTYLTDGSGRSLYLWVADSGDRSSCLGSCAEEWPPVTAAATPSASGAVQAGELGTIARSGGGRQVTYKGHPLYYFAGDGGPGRTAGQGSDDFGAKWWLVAPSGAAVKSASGSDGDSSHDGGSDAGGGW